MRGISSDGGVVAGRGKAPHLMEVWLQGGARHREDSSDGWGREGVRRVPRTP